MTITELNAADVKHYLRTYRGLLLKDFADQNGYPLRLVSDVIRKHNKGTYGKGREILEKLNQELQSIQQEIDQQH